MVTQPLPWAWHSLIPAEAPHIQWETVYFLTQIAEEKDAKIKNDNGIFTPTDTWHNSN